MKNESKARIALLVVGYILAVAASGLFIAYLFMDGLRKGTDSWTIHLIDSAMLLGGIFLTLKGFADRIKSFWVRVGDRHFWWVYSNIQIFGGIAVALIAIVALILHII